MGLFVLLLKSKYYRIFQKIAPVWQIDPTENDFITI